MNLGPAANLTATVNYHARLLSTIEELEYVPKAKRDQMDCINELQRKIDSCKAKIDTLAEKTMKERKDHELLRDSAARRFAHTLAGHKDKCAQQERCAN